MVKPVKPIIDALSFADVGTGRKGAPIVAALNTMLPYLAESIAYREGSATSLTTRIDISQYNLQPGALVRLGVDGTTLISPSGLPIFTDGGYYQEDRIGYKTFDEIVRAFPDLSETNQDNLSVNTAANQRYIGDPTSVIGSVAPVLDFRQPMYPFNLSCIVRGIVRLGDFNMRFEHYDRFDRSARHSEMRINEDMDFLCYTPFGPTNEDIVNEYILRDINNSLPSGANGSSPQNAILVFDIRHTVNNDPEDLETPPGVISCVFGAYSTIQQAYADTRPGRAFSCLDPAHPNYMGAISYQGRFLDGFDGSTGYTVPIIRANRLYYSEILAGNPCNNVLNAGIADLPPAVELDNSLLDPYNL